MGDEIEDTKPGYKTSEFWLALAVVVGIFVVVATGKMDVMSACALGAAALTSVGYTHGRSVAKAAILLFILMLPGCTNVAKNERDIIREWRIVHRHTLTYEPGWANRAQEADDDSKVYADDSSLVVVKPHGE